VSAWFECGGKLKFHNGLRMVAEAGSACYLPGRSASGP